MRLFWLFSLSILLSACAITQPIIPTPPLEPESNYLDNIHPNTVLVLGSGAARGIAHVGVLKALEEQQIKIDMIVGTSAGSIIGALYADKPSAQKLAEVIMSTSRSNIVDIKPSTLFSGIFSGRTFQEYLLSHLQAKSFDQLPIPLLVVATDFETGAEHVLSSGPIVPAVTASSAVPPFFPPVELYGREYIDGGFVDPVAIDVAKRFHPRLIIAVDLDPGLSQQLPRTNPQILIRGINIMESKLSNYSTKDADVVIHPRLQHISMFDGSAREKSIKVGYDAAMLVMPKIKILLKNKH